MDLLDKEDIFEIHKEAIRMFGGSPTYYHYTGEKIESIIAQQYPYFGNDKYPSIFEKAAMLWYFLTKGHCFADGNKRVAFYAAAALLKINGYRDTVNDNDDEAFDKAIQIACAGFSGTQLDLYIQELASWLRERFIE